MLSKTASPSKGSVAVTARPWGHGNGCLVAQQVQRKSPLPSRELVGSPGRRRTANTQQAGAAAGSAVGGHLHGNNDNDVFPASPLS
jgi:hypothetical protein